MKKKRLAGLWSTRVIFSGIMLALAVGLMCPASQAADPRDEVIEKLMRRVEELEDKVRQLSDQMKSPKMQPLAVSEEEIQMKVDEILAEKSKKTEGLSMPEISGYINTTYNYNFNKPASRTTKLGTPDGAAGNNLSSYITQANTFDLNAAHLALTGSLKEGFGYTIEMDAGADANVNTSSGGGAADDFDIQEAYLTYVIPGLDVGLKAGKFVTLEGIEVIESPLNPTISRGHLFGMVEPFTQTGFLLSRALPFEGLDGLELRAGLTNGWDLLKDNNEDKTVFGGIGINLGDLATGGFSVYYGPEQADNDENDRTSMDLTIFTKPFPKLTLALQGNWGTEEGISGGRDKWKGVGIQPVYEFTDKFSLGGRIEYMENKLGSRFGNDGGEAANFTVTPAYKLNDNTTLRLEYRHDVANNAFFEGEDGVFDEKRVNQFLSELSYTF